MGETSPTGDGAEGENLTGKTETKWTAPKKGKKMLWFLFKSEFGGYFEAIAKF
jgi:hypothetical protein